MSSLSVLTFPLPAMLFFGVCVLSCAPQPTLSSPPNPTTQSHVSPPDTLSPHTPTKHVSSPHQAPRKEPLKTCPKGMIFIDELFCPARHFTCLRAGKSKPSHPAKCLEFDPSHPCLGRTRRQRFCIDVYEFPNTKDARPPSMINAWEADLLCREQGKRLCWESEWTQACQGPKGYPYAYGTTRNASTCNIDRPYIAPYQRTLHGSDPTARHNELLRLDQSVRSGELEECKSEFGVHDQSGNFSEWVYLEKARGRCTWAGTKGGHWVPVRNVCHLTSTRHPESWRYYPLTTRCCADPDLTQLPTTPEHLKNIPVWRPPRAQNTLHYLNHGPLNRGWTPDHTP